MKCVYPSPPHLLCICRNMIFYYLCSIWCFAVLIGSWKQQQSGTGICVRECLFEYTNQIVVFCAIAADARERVSTSNGVMWYAGFIGPHLIMLMTTIYIAVFVLNYIGRETASSRRHAKNAARELLAIYVK